LPFSLDDSRKLEAELAGPLWADEALPSVLMIPESLRRQGPHNETKEDNAFSLDDSRKLEAERLTGADGQLREPFSLDDSRKLEAVPPYRRAAPMITPSVLMIPESLRRRWESASRS